LTISIQGTQLDFQAAIVGDTLSYFHVYEVQANIVGNDLDDNFVLNGTCNPDPCLNGGICQRGLAGDFSCLCPDGYRGKVFIKK
jgi:hypothetical protein